MLTLAFTDPVAARLVTCSPCADPTPRVVLEFPVTVADAAGPGGSVQSLEVRVTDRSRGSEVARNVRPNADFALPETSIAPRGSLILPAGLVFPPQPPRDELQVTVIVTLTDGRRAERSGAMVRRRRTDSFVLLLSPGLLLRPRGGGA